MNHVSIIGYICKNLKAETTPTGRKRIQFDISVRREFKSANGRYGYDFPHIQSWNPGVNAIIEKYADEGSLVAIEGRLQTDTFMGRDGKKKKIIYINLEKLGLIKANGPGSPATAQDFASMGETVEDEDVPADIENLDW